MDALPAAAGAVGPPPRPSFSTTDRPAVTVNVVVAFGEASDRLEDAGGEPELRLLVDPCLRRQVPRRLAPRDAAPHQVAHAVEHLAHAVRPLRHVLTEQGPVPRDEGPLPVTHVVPIPLSCGTVGGHLHLHSRKLPGPNSFGS